MPRQSFDLVLEAAVKIAPEVKHFRFRRQDGMHFDFTPGQFITFMLPTKNKVLRRSYSLAAAPDKHGTIELAASYVTGGTASETLFNLQVGDVLSATGPFGRLVLPSTSFARYIFVATGTGVTPYRSMLPALAERIQEHDAKVVLLQGVRHVDELLYGEDFLAFQQQYHQFQYLACYSREQLSSPATHERCQRVQFCFSELNLNPSHDLVYLCGNPNMIDEAFVYLTECGFATAQIKREKYISSN